ncbi:hypothetical protein [Cellulosimicrobium sp. Marseille-Q4280]|uniref:hypothetical protein n=1 Tax=Cellulosimicrobium sp. Marseille-Q4280 TaxID=2937992 RepID=UPI0020408E70|nr:hypothetical protein [Cellulosimicrobium sp. Marseille-Q4280]
MHRIMHRPGLVLPKGIASGTLDEHLRRVQHRKAEILDPVLGQGYDTSVTHQETDDVASVASIAIAIAIVTERVGVRAKALAKRQPARQLAHARLTARRRARFRPVTRYPHPAARATITPWDSSSACSASEPSPAPTSSAHLRRVPSRSPARSRR